MKSSFQLIAPPRRATDGLRMNIPAEGILDPQNPVAQPAWITCDNMVINNGQLQKVPGWYKVGSVPSEFVSLIFNALYASGTVITVVCTNKNVYRYYNGQINPVNANAFGQSNATRWEAFYLAGKWWFTNPVDGTWTWDGINQMIQVATGAPAAAHGEQYTDHAMLGNLATGDQPGSYSVLGSGLNGADFDTANVDSDADLITLPDNGSQVRRMLRILNMLAVYKDDVIINLSYIGPGLEYYAVTQEPNRGTIAPASVVDIGGRHLFYGPDDLYSYDGSYSQPFGDRVWQYWNGLIIPATRPQIWSLLDRRSEYESVTMGYQSLAGQGALLGSPANLPPPPNFDRAIVYHYKRDVDAFTTRDWPFTAAGYTQNPTLAAGTPTFNDLVNPMDDTDDAYLPPAASLEDYSILAADIFGNLFIHDPAVTTAGAASLANDNGFPIVSTLETGDWAPSGPDRVSICNGLMIDCPSLTGTPLKVYVSARRRLGDPVIYPANPITYIPGQQWVNFMQAGVWYRIKFVKSDGTMNFRGWAMSVKDGGAF